MYQRRLKIVLTLFMIMLSSASDALNQYAKQWVAINIQQAVHENNPWQYLLYSQWQFTDESHPWKVMLVEGGLGYQRTSDESFWAGYRWSGVNPNNGFFQINRLFQQYMTQQRPDRLYQFAARTRLEEYKRSNSGEVAIRLRQRISLFVHHAITQETYPYFYDEVFFQLNHPAYVANTLVGQNRLFIGIDIFRTKNTWWELGYINQYIFRSPLQSQNQMNHVLSVTYHIR